MCGISGVVSQNILGQYEISLVEKMNMMLSHRGPDDHGAYRDKNISLAMRRLSIIDIAGGFQPLFNETKTVVLIANAEIYNYIELTEELKSRGHIFQTKSDCEVIVHLYEEKGIACLQDLRGMFAFAIWDVSKQRLFLSRDRMGEKPLYLYENDGRFFFSSEIKALLKVFNNEFSLSPSAVDLFFHYQYVPEPMTPIAEIRKLPAAHYIDIDIVKWDTRPRRYWDPLSAPPVNIREGAGIIREELERVISLTLRSDVPVGVALSGGLDSSSIAALSKLKYKDKLSAFTVGYPGAAEHDERRAAGTFAKQLGLPFYDIEISTNSFIEFFPEQVFLSDDPIADMAAYGYFTVMRLAKEYGIKVMLCGFGGDELFWGYEWVRNAVKQSKEKFNLIYSHNEKKPEKLFLKFMANVHYLLKYGNTPKNQMIFYGLAPNFKYSDSALPRLYSKEFQQGLLPDNSQNLFVKDGDWEPIDLNICQLLFDGWLTSNCIALGDRLSMASSVELRLPLVDYKLIELIFGLRMRNSDYELGSKAWLVESMRGILPEEMLNRPKQGFWAPVEEWSHAVLQRYTTLALNGYLVKNKIFDKTKLERYLILARDTAVYANFNRSLAYKIIYLEIWCRLFLEKATIEDIAKEAR